MLRGAFTRCARPRDSRTAPRVARHSVTTAFIVAVAARLRTAPAAHPRAPEASLVTYADRTLTCVDCGSEFTHSADDQKYYTEKGFSSDPKRCVSCRASRRAARDTGYTASDLGGPRGYERSAPMREYFAVLCSECGNQSQVPFRPRMDRPVYCSDCFR